MHFQTFRETINFHIIKHQKSICVAKKWIFGGRDARGNSHFLLEGEKESGPFVQDAFYPDSAAVPVNNPFDGSQADARAFELLGGVQTLKGFEDQIGIGHVESAAVVLDKIGLLASSFGRSEFNFRFPALSRKFQGIPQEIFHGNPQEPFIPLGHTAFSDDEIQLPVGIALPVFGNQGKSQGA